MNISLSDSLKSFVDDQVSERGFSSSSEYVRELIRKDLERTKLHELLLEGAQSPVTTEADHSYFTDLRNRVHQQK